MIGTVSIEVNAKNPNMPLWPLRAYVNSPSSLRLVNVPRKIGNWCISAVRLVVVYPDGGVQAAQCVQTGGVWVGTVDGTATSGTCENGYTVFADGTDENGNPVTGYVLGKGDVEILHADGTPSPDPARYSVKLLSASAEQPIEGDMWPTEDGYVIWQGGQAHLLGTPFDQISAYVESAVSAKADLSALEDYAKTDELSSKADLSAIPTKTSQLSNDSGFITSADIPTPSYIEDANGNKVEADLDYEIHNPTSTNWTLHYNRCFGQDVTLEYSDGAWRYEGTNYYPQHPQQEKVILEYNDNRWSFYTQYYDTETASWLDRDDCWFNDGERAEDITFVCGARITRTMDDTGKLAKESDLPTKTSDLTNDSGFVEQNGMAVIHDLTCDSLVANQAHIVGYATESDLSAKADVSALHQDYIEDSAGNRINANLSCTYIDNTAWEVTDPSSNKYVLEYVGFIQSYHTWECIVPENIKLVLTYANDWEFQVYTWQETGPGGDYDWVLDINGSYDGNSDITTIPYFVNRGTTYNYSAQRPVTKHLTLATKEYVDSRLSALEARIAALEGN